MHLIAVYIIGLVFGRGNPMTGMMDPAKTSTSSTT